MVVVVKKESPDDVAKTGELFTRDDIITGFEHRFRGLRVRALSTNGFLKVQLGD